MGHVFLKKNRITGLALLIAMLGSVAGCGASSGETDVVIQGLVPGQGTAAGDVGYEVPQQSPVTLVDQLGYGTDMEKRVIFRGGDLPGSFSVYALDGGEVAYTGQIMKTTYDKELGEYVSYGYFSDLTREGEYYISSDVIGESYSFSIKDGILDSLFDTACRKYYRNRCGIALSESYAGESAHSACHTTMARLRDDPSVQIDVTGGWHMDEQAGRDTAVGARLAQDLVLAYEMNPAAFTDEAGIPESGNLVPDILDEVRYEAEWLLKMQDSRTGGVYAAAVTDLSKGGDLFAAPVLVTPVSMDSTISFAAMMARFSYFYQQFDQQFATTCLKAADRAWTCFLNNQSADDDSAALNAAAQLYRATGASSYHEVLRSYFKREDFGELFDGDENAFLGAVTYLSINQKVDVETCTRLMKLLMQKSEDIASKASSSAYLVCSDAPDGDFRKLLSDMRALTITDHIIYNHEYTMIIENHVHYLLGMNPRAVNYLTDDTQGSYVNVGGTGLMNDPEEDALLIFMLSVLV